MNFYLTQKGLKLGPYSVEQIQQFVRQGLTTPDDQVWADGWPAWMPISNVPGLVRGRSSSENTLTPPLNQVPQPGHSQLSSKPEQSGFPYATGKNPVVACVLSLVIVGTGQFYNGDWVKGWIMMVSCIVASFFSLGACWFIWAVFSAYDAYRVADRRKPLYKLFPIWS